jgi:ethylbenzene dioxygenase ferredoxin subunit
MKRIRVCPASELEPGTGRRVTGEGHEPIALFRLESGCFAISDTCTHAEGSLSEGWVDGEQVICPIHPGEFHIPTGKACSFPAERNVRTYRALEQDGEVYVELEG